MMRILDMILTLKHNDEDEGLYMMLTSRTMMRMRVWT
jgi:hypothetical protein